MHCGVMRRGTVSRLPRVLDSNRGLDMKASVAAFAFGVLSVGLLAAGPGGIDPIETRGTLPEELAEDETQEQLLDRVIDYIVPFDHMMTPACGKPRRLEFLSVAKAEVNDTLADRYAQGEQEYFIIRVRSTGCGQARVHNLY